MIIALYTILLLQVPVSQGITVGSTEAELDSIATLAFDLYADGAYDSAISYATAGRDQSYNGRFAGLYYEFSFLLANSHKQSGDLELAEAVFSNAFKQKNILGKHTKLGDLHNHYGQMLDELGRYADALRQYIEAEKIFREYDDSYGLAATLLNQGYLFQAFHSGNEQVAMLNEALAMTDHAADGKGATMYAELRHSINLNLAVSLALQAQSKSGTFDDAINTAREALVSSTDTIPRLQANLCLAFIFAISQNHQQDLAETIENAITMADTVRMSNEDRATYFYTLGKLAESRTQVHQAMQLYLQSDSIAKRADSFFDQYNATEAICNLARKDRQKYTDLYFNYSEQLDKLKKLKDVQVASLVDILKTKPGNNIMEVFEKYVAIVSSLVFLIALFIVALANKQFNNFSIFILRVIIALASAGFATVIPGLLQIQFMKESVLWKATGAIAVFLLVYAFNPPQMKANSLKKRPVPKRSSADKSVDATKAGNQI